MPLANRRPSRSNAENTDAGIPPAELANAIQKLDGCKLSAKKKAAVEPISAAKSLAVFVPMMVKKNVELQLQALQMIEFMCGLMPDVLQLEEGETLRNKNVKQLSGADTERYVLISVLRQSKEEFEKGEALEQEMLDQLIEMGLFERERLNEEMGNALDSKQADDLDKHRDNARQREKERMIRTRRDSEGDGREAKPPRSADRRPATATKSSKPAAPDTKSRATSPITRPGTRNQVRSSITRAETGPRPSSSNSVLRTENRATSPILLPETVHQASSSVTRPKSTYSQVRTESRASSPISGHQFLPSKIRAVAGSGTISSDIRFRTESRASSPVSVLGTGHWTPPSLNQAGLERKPRLRTESRASSPIQLSKTRLETVFSKTKADRGSGPISSTSRLQTEYRASSPIPRPETRYQRSTCIDKTDRESARKPSDSRFRTESRATSPMSRVNTGQHTSSSVSQTNSGSDALSPKTQLTSQSRDSSPIPRPKTSFPKIQADTGTQTQTETGSQTQSDKGSSTQADKGFQTQSDPESQTQSDTGFQTQSDKGFQTQSYTGSQTQTDTGSQTSSCCPPNTESHASDSRLETAAKTSPKKTRPAKESRASSFYSCPGTELQSPPCIPVADMRSRPQSFTSMLRAENRSPPFSRTEVESQAPPHKLRPRTGHVVLSSEYRPATSRRASSILTQHQTDSRSPPLKPLPEREMRSSSSTSGTSLRSRPSSITRASTESEASPSIARLKTGNKTSISKFRPETGRRAPSTLSQSKTETRNSSPAGDPSSDPLPDMRSQPRSFTSQLETGKRSPTSKSHTDIKNQASPAILRSKTDHEASLSNYRPATGERAPYTLSHSIAEPRHPSDESRPPTASSSSSSFFISYIRQRPPSSMSQTTIDASTPISWPRKEYKTSSSSFRPTTGRQVPTTRPQSTTEPRNLSPESEVDTTIQSSSPDSQYESGSRTHTPNSGYGMEQEVLFSADTRPRPPLSQDESKPPSSSSRSKTAQHPTSSVSLHATANNETTPSKSSTEKSPPKTGSRPLTTGSRPPTPDKRPPTTTSIAPAPDKRPLTTASIPLTPAKRPSMTDSILPTPDKRPPSAGNAPATVENRPPTTGIGRSATDKRHFLTNNGPSTIGNRPSTGVNRFTPDKRTPLTGNRPPTADAKLTEENSIEKLNVKRTEVLTESFCETGTGEGLQKKREQEPAPSELRNQLERERESVEVDESGTMSSADGKGVGRTLETAERVAIVEVHSEPYSATSEREAEEVIGRYPLMENSEDDAKERVARNAISGKRKMEKSIIGGNVIHDLETDRDENKNSLRSDSQSSRKKLQSSKSNKVTFNQVVDVECRDSGEDNQVTSADSFQESKQLGKKGTRLNSSASKKSVRAGSESSKGNRKDKAKESEGEDKGASGVVLEETEKKVKLGDEIRAMLRTAAGRIQTADMTARTNYLRSQRDRLLEMKRQQREKQLNSTDEIVRRPRTANAVRGILKRGSLLDAEKETNIIATRNAIYSKLKEKADS